VLTGALRLTDLVACDLPPSLVVRTLVTVTCTRPLAASRARTLAGRWRVTPNVPALAMVSVLAGILIVAAPIRALAVVVRRPALFTVTLSVADPGLLADCIAVAVERGAAGAAGGEGSSGATRGGATTTGSPVAMPESSAAPGEEASSLGMLRLAAFGPGVFGAKLTWTTQFAPTPTDWPEHVSASTLNSDASDPTGEAAPTARAAVPPLLNVKLLAGELVPVSRLGKAPKLGERVAFAIATTTPRGVVMPVTKP